MLIVGKLSGSQQVIADFSTYEIWTVIAGIVGAWSGLILCRDWMGHPGIQGLMRSLVGCVAVSFVGSLIGGTLALPLYGTMFGPFSLLMTLIGAPILALFWLSSLLMAHSLLLVWRAERESVFLADRLAEEL